MAIMPIALAIDFGGVLRWSQYIAAMTMAGIVGFTFVGYLATKDRGQLAQQILLVPLLLWAGFIWFQTLSLPPTLVGWLSPASVTAYTDWLRPYVGDAGLPSRFPISVSVADTRHALAMFCVIIAAAWSAAVVFNSRMRLGMLLSVLAVGSAIVSAIGLWIRIFPTFGFFGFEDSMSAGSFATFINRNNSALFLNLGLAASLGLLSWRLTALTGQEVDDPEFEFNDLFSLINDRESMIGILSAALCVSGLLVGGSRGGVVAAFMGTLLAFGWVRQRRGLVSFPVIAVMIGLSVAVLLVPTDLSLESIQRMKFLTAESESTLLNDGRLLHWPDGLRTAAAHLPAGSGLATYGDAVLPHMQTSTSSGFHHADNLWIELLTEQGVFGLIFTLSLLALVIRSLHRMGDSADPIDQGLRIAGWYAIGALIASQSFDFGLVIPANTFALAMLLPAIVARDVAAGTAAVALEHVHNTHGESLSERRDLRGLFRSRRRTTALVVSSVLPLLSILVALPRLKSDAHVEVFERTLKAEMKWIRTDDEALRQWIGEFSSIAASDPSPNVFESLCVLVYHRARLLDVAQRNPREPEEAVRLYEQTAPIVRRTQWLRDRNRPGETSPSIDHAPSVSAYTPPPETANAAALYRHALDCSTLAIQWSPLAQTPHPYQVYLDFVHQDIERTKAALHHMTVLFSQEPRTLLQIGSLAADSNEQALAIELWRNAVQARPSLTRAVLTEATSHGVKELHSVIPASSDAYRLAAAYLLTNIQGDTPSDAEVTAVPHSELLEESLNGLACGTCETQDERASCEQLAGDIEYRLGRFDESFASYQEALRYSPMNAELRLKLINRLKEQGQRRVALDEARKGRRHLKDDPRFTQAIETMAAEDLRSIENPDLESPNSTPPNSALTPSGS